MTLTLAFHADEETMQELRGSWTPGLSVVDVALTEPSYGKIKFTVDNGRLAYSWGAVYGPVEVYNATKAQLRIEIGGSGDVVTFSFLGAGPARSLQLQGVTFARAE